MNKLIESITFCKRIGALTLGFDPVRESMKQGNAKLVLLASDLSPKTRKEVAYLCGRYAVKSLPTPFTLDEFWYLVGKRAGIIAVTQEAFAEKIRTVIEDETDRSERLKEDAEYGD